MNEQSEALADALASIAPSVVRVEARRGYPLSGVVWSEDAVVTTHRAVEFEDDIRIGLADGSTRSAEFVGSDPRTDIALLQVENGGLRPATRSRGEPRVGQLVLLAGRPGANLRASLGIVAVSEGEWQTFAGGKIERFLQTDAAPFPGFSGGPLLTQAGEVLGINTATFARRASVTLPASTVGRTVDTLRHHGKVRRGYIGIAGQLVRLPAQLQELSDQRSGVLVVSVESDSPAAHAGLSLGDTLVGIGGRPIRSPEDLALVLDEDRIGQVLAVRFLRGGELNEASLTVGERS